MPAEIFLVKIMLFDLKNAKKLDLHYKTVKDPSVGHNFVCLTI